MGLNTGATLPTQDAVASSHASVNPNSTSRGQLASADASNLIYRSGTAVSPTSQPRQTTLSFSHGHLNITKSSLRLDTSSCAGGTSSSATTGTDKGDESNHHPGHCRHSASTDSKNNNSNAACHAETQVDNLAHTTYTDNKDRDSSHGANETCANSSAATNKANRRCGMMNEHGLGDESMDDHSDHQDHAANAGDTSHDTRDNDGTKEGGMDNPLDLWDQDTNSESTPATDAPPPPPPRPIIPNPYGSDLSAAQEVSESTAVLSLRQGSHVGVTPEPELEQ
ncbi:hypothetical protein BYT27DRAFT_7262383 [Phlegmacium glaucopus]|nr:hypothetical protein BYT27DRAFT_7262383 [Phlegmacium glaucopus]